MFAGFIYISFSFSFSLLGETDALGVTLYFRILYIYNFINFNLRALSLSLLYYIEDFLKSKILQGRII